MAKTRFPVAGRRGRGLFWLVAALLALALAGLGLEHGGGNPTSINGVLTHATAQASNDAGANANPPGERDQGPGANPSADDANHHDDDCDNPGDTCGHAHKPPPPKCDKNGAEAFESASDDPNGEGTTKKDQKDEEKQDHKACEMSAHANHH